MRFLFLLILLFWVKAITLGQNNDELIRFYAFLYAEKEDSAFVSAQKLLQTQTIEEVLRFYAHKLAKEDGAKAYSFMREYEEKADFSLDFAMYYAERNKIDSAVFFIAKYLDANPQVSKSVLYAIPAFSGLQKSTQWKELLSDREDLPVAKLLFDVDFWLKTGNLEKALLQLDDFILQHKNHLVYAKRAQILLSLKDYKAALADFERAFKIVALPEYSFGMAKALFYQEKYKRSNEYLQQVLRGNPHHFRAMEYLIFSAFESKDYPLAEKYARQYTNYIQNDSIEFKMASIFYLKDDFLSALLHVNKAIALNSYQQDYYRLRGLIYYQNENYIVAEQDFTLYLDFNPVDADILYFRGECRFYLNKPENACKDWQTAAKYYHQQALKNISRYCK